MNLGSFYTDADRNEAARKYWNGEQILREYPSYYSQPRPSVQIDEIVARIRAANKAEGWYKGQRAMTGQSDYEARMRWAASTLPKPFRTISGTVVGIGSDNVGLIHNGKAELISFSRLSLASELIAQSASAGDEILLKVRP